MEAIIRACQTGQLAATVSVVVAPKEDIPAVSLARSYDVAVEIADQERLAKALENVDWVCLAGYLRLLPLEVLKNHPGRVLNIHPSLLPKYGGKGMYGLRVQEAVLAAGETEAGCSVHHVSEHYDEGAVFLQKRCPVLPNDTPESLAARVLALEHEAYIEALRSLIHG